jgi:hypothetical protein
METHAGPLQEDFVAPSAGSCTGLAGRGRPALTGFVPPTLVAPARSALARFAVLLLILPMPLASCQPEQRSVAVVPDTLAGFRLSESLPDLRTGLGDAAAALHCYRQVDGIHTGCRLAASASPHPFGTVSLDLENGRVTDIVATLGGEWAAEPDTIFARFAALYGVDPDTVVHDTLVASATWFDPAGVRNASVVCLFLGERTCSIALRPGTIKAADARTDSTWAARSAKRDSARAGAVVTVRPQELDMLAGDLTGLHVRLEKVRVLEPVLRDFLGGPYWLVTDDYGGGGAVFTNCPGTRLRPGRVLRIRGTIRSYDAARRRFPALDAYPNGLWLDPDSCVAVR